MAESTRSGVKHRPRRLKDDSNMRDTTPRSCIYLHPREYLSNHPHSPHILSSCRDLADRRESRGRAAPQDPWDPQAVRAPGEKAGNAGRRARPERADRSEGPDPADLRVYKAGRESQELPDARVSVAMGPLAAGVTYVACRI